MGTDIHAYIELVGKDGIDFIAEFNLDRSYTMFAIMAEVRGDPGITLFTPRGIPYDISARVREEYCIWNGAARDWQVNTDWHNASWLNSAEMDQVKAAFEKHYPFPREYAALLAAMKALGDSARVVFWFDN